MESAAEELKAEGIQANAVLPGTIAFLLSDAAASVTGAAVPVNGRG